MLLNLRQPSGRSRPRAIGVVAGAVLVLLLLWSIQLLVLAFMLAVVPAATSPARPPHALPTATAAPWTPSQKDLAAAYLRAAQPDLGTLSADLGLDCSDFASCRSAYTQIGRDARKAQDHIATRAVPACIARGASDYRAELRSLIESSDLVLSGFDQGDMSEIDQGVARMLQAKQQAGQVVQELQSADCPD